MSDAPGRDMKTELAKYVREQARWRESKAEEHADDERSERSAARLSRLAEHIERLPDTDARLAALARVHAGYPSGEFAPGENGAYLVSRFAFDSADADQDLDEFLDKLVRVIVAEDRREQARQLDAQLDSREVDALLDEFDGDR